MNENRKLYVELDNLMGRMYRDLEAGVPEEYFTVNYAGNEVKIPLSAETMNDISDFADSVMESVRWQFADRLASFIRDCHGDGTNYFKFKGTELSPDEIEKHLYHGDIVGASIWMWLNMTSAHGPEELAEKAAELQAEMMELMEI